MTIKVTPKMKRLLEKRIKARQYATPEEVILAGLAALEQLETFGDFEPGELAALIEEGEASLRNEPAVPLAEAYRQHLAHRQQARARRSRKSA